MTVFDTLREFAQRYDALKRRAPGDLASLVRRTTRLYIYERHSALELAKGDGESALMRAEMRYPEGLSVDRFSKEIRLLLNANRDVGQRNVRECFDGGFFTQLRLGSNGELAFGYDFPSLYPTSYMIGFWQRRDFEGTSMLARFAIDQLLVELRR